MSQLPGELFVEYVSSGERLYRISGEGLVGWNLLIPANQAIRIRGSVRP